MSAIPTFKPSEGKREEFRKYLEKNGVLDALTKVLVNLYEEVDKPVDALEYIRDKLAIQAGIETQKQLQTKYDDAQGRIKDLENKIQQMKSDAEAKAVVEEEPAADAPAEQPVVDEAKPDVPPEEAEQPPAEEPQ